MDYQLGYKVIKRHYVTGESVLNKIKYSKLRAIGAGATGLVMTDGKYAIKVGYVDSYDVNFLKVAADYGFAVPILYFAPEAIIDSRLMKFIHTAEFYQNGHKVNNIAYYFQRPDVTGILVSMLAIPFMNHECNVPYGSDARMNAANVANQVRREYQRVSGEEWEDAHPWNLGIYNGGLIILDP